MEADLLSQILWCMSSEIKENEKNVYCSWTEVRHVQKERHHALWFCFTCFLPEVLTSESESAIFRLNSRPELKENVPLFSAGLFHIVEDSGSVLSPLSSSYPSARSS